jgi:hypothetical protein
MTEPAKPTVKAVVAYAEQLRAEADRAALRDPYLDPYRPTEAAARKLAQRFTHQRLREIEALHVTDEERNDLIDQAPHVGAQRALDDLKRRAAEQQHKAREDRERSDRALKRLRRHRQQDARDQAARRQGLSPGQRIDRVIRQLGVTSDVPAVRLDGDRVHGGDGPQLPVGPDGSARLDDHFTLARRRALALADDLEQLLDRDQRRDLDAA